MECMDCGTLQDFFEFGNLKNEYTMSEPALSQITCQILLLLNNLKKKNIAHRDLKPENIFPTKTGLIKGNNSSVL